MENTNKKYYRFFSIFAIILICIICIFSTPITFQNDTYYTIKIGEHIQNEGIDFKDPFSWHENLDYTYPHWLFDLIVYKAYSLLGFTGIYILTIIFSCILGITLYYVNLKLSKSTLISFLISIATIYLMQGFIAARAQIVTYTLFILTIFFIEQFLKKKKLSYVLALFLISTIMANVHVAVWPFFFILFLPYIGEYITCLILDRIKYNKSEENKLKKEIEHLKKASKEEEKIQELENKLTDLQKEISEKKNNNSYKIQINENKNAIWLIPIMIICIFAGLLTPLKSTPYTYLIKTIMGNTTSYISEHAPITLISSPFALIFIIIFVVLLAFYKTKIKLSHLYLVSGLIALTLVSTRQYSLLIILGSIVICNMIVNLVLYSYSDFLKKSEEIMSNSLIYYFLSFLVITLSLSLGKLLIGDKFVDNNLYPVQACDYILENIDIENVRFFNEYNYGSYMIYRGIPVFIDSRADLYAPEFSGLENDIFLDFMEAAKGEQYYEDLFDKYNITHVILKKDSKIYIAISESHDENYKELYSDENFIIYDRLNCE